MCVFVKGGGGGGGGKGGGVACVLLCYLLYIGTVRVS